MDDLRRMAIFATVVQHGSMSGAARALGMSPSAVSQQVRRLETEGGVTLLHRSTRQLALTEAGERFHAHCAAMLHSVRQARAELQQTREAPVGLLRMTAPVGFARHIAVALGPALAQHPDLSLHLQVDDWPIDLIQARIDLAIRFGPLPDSTWVARRLGALRWWICAQPAWTRIHGPFQHPDALLGHEWLGFVRDRVAMRLPVRSPQGMTRELEIEPRLSSNNQALVQQMCIDGLGPAMLASIDVYEDVAAGRLVRLLPEWTLPAMDISAVTPQRETQPAKVRLAIAALQDYLRALPGIER